MVCIGYKERVGSLVARQLKGNVHFVEKEELIGALSHSRKALVTSFLKLYRLSPIFVNKAGSI